MESSIALAFCNLLILQSEQIVASGFASKMPQSLHSPRRFANVVSLLNPHLVQTQLIPLRSKPDTLYKCLMELYSQKHLTDEEFFPNHVKAHIDRGIILLEQEARYGDDLLIHLTELEKGI